MDWDSARWADVVNVNMVIKHNQLPEEDDTMGLYHS